MVETDVHFPTDINLLYDAVRKSVELTARLCADYGVPGWRQSNSLLEKLRKQLHFCEKRKHSTSKKPEKQARKEEEMKRAHSDYLTASIRLMDRMTDSAVAVLCQAAGNAMATATVAAITGLTDSNVMSP